MLDMDFNLTLQYSDLVSEHWSLDYQ